LLTIHITVEPGPHRTASPMDDDQRDSAGPQRPLEVPVSTRGEPWPRAALRWLGRIDPGTHRRIKGLRLVTAYGLGAALGTLQDVAHSLPRGLSLGALAGGFALWASVSEGRTTRVESSRDLLLLSAAAALGAALFIGFSPLLHQIGRAGPELTLVTGAFLVGYLKRFGLLGAGIGSQIYIG
jgi:hypothetical protein